MTVQDIEAALFIDFENIHASVRNKYNIDVDWQLLVKSLEQFGRIAIRRAYSNWGENARYQGALMRFAIEPINAASLRKNVSDIFLAVDAMDTLSNHPEVETFLVVSGDGDFTYLVQKLRSHQKRVVGMGVQGASAGGLVEACDEFIFYDDLLPVSQKRAALLPSPSVAGDGGTTLLSPLQKALQETLPSNDGWISGASLISRLRRINGQFDDEIARAGFERFRDFLEAFPHMIEIRAAPGKGHMEVRRISGEGEPQAVIWASSSELVETDYIEVLRQQRLFMTPSRHRPDIIMRAYQIFQEQSPPSLTALRALTQQAFVTDPDIDDKLVKEVVHQLFRSFSFEFDKQPGMLLWDCPFRLRPHIKTGQDMLRNSDIDILKLLKRGLPAGVDVDPAIAACLLYGRDDHPAFIQRVTNILEEFVAEL